MADETQQAQSPDPPPRRPFRWPQAARRDRRRQHPRPRRPAGARPRARGAQPRQAAGPVQPTGPVTVPSGVSVKDLSAALGHHRRADHQDHDGARRDGHDHPVAQRRVGAADRRRGRARGRDQARRRRRLGAGGVRGLRGGSRGAPAGRHDHGPRRPRQDDAARRDPRDVGRRHRGRRDHAAHRCLPGRPRRPQDHVPRHAGPRGVHRDARPWREGHGHRDPRRRRRRRRDAADARVDLARPRGRRADRRRGQQDRRPDANLDRVAPSSPPRACSPRSGVARRSSPRSPRSRRLNLDELLEKLLLVADAELDLRANPTAEASGPIIESRLDVGRGPVATMLVHRGTLRVGDAIVAGDASGKVRALYDYKGEKVKEARPGEPVEILGFDRPPPAGELARVVEHERQAKDLAQKRAERLRREQLAQRSKRGVSLESLFSQLQEGVVQDLNIVLKGDVQGSVEALLGELGKIQHSEVRVNVIHTGVGGITENDVNLASASNALVIGFNVRPSAEACRSPTARASTSAPTASSTSSPTRSSRRSSACSRRSDRGDARRGRGARAVQGLPPGHDRRLHGHDRRRPPQRAGAGRARRHRDLRHVDLAAEAVQGRRARGHRGLRVRHPARGLQRPQGRRRPRDLRDAQVERTDLDTPPGAD